MSDFRGYEMAMREMQDRLAAERERNEGLRAVCEYATQTVADLEQELAEARREHSASEAHLRETILELRDAMKALADERTAHTRTRLQVEFNCKMAGDVVRLEAELEAARGKRCGNCADWERVNLSDYGFCNSEMSECSQARQLTWDNRMAWSEWGHGCPSWRKK